MNNKGFTLIEIVIAIAVFAVIASITSTILYQSFQIKQRTESEANLINKIQLSFSLFNRDTKQIVERPVRGNQMHLFPSFLGQEDYLEFTTGGLVNPMAIESTSNLKRVAYLCKKRNLIRRVWSQLDTPDRDLYHDKIMLDNLNKCSFAYIGMHNNIVPSWYQYSTKRQGKTISTPLPKAIELTLNINKLGMIKLVFSI